jgi:ubiquinone/menaquinone biosynthesis C-methylase UbiE
LFEGAKGSTALANVIDNLVPPCELLFDGTTTHEQFISIGENFVRNYLIQRARLKPTDKILDIGCGIGQKARPLTRFLCSEGVYEGFDVTASGINWCKEAYQDYSNFHFQYVDLYNSHYNRNATQFSASFQFPFPDREFDLVFLSSVFTHMLPDELCNYISESSRVLKNGGRCVATYFLINPEVLQFIKFNNPSISIPCEHSPVCWVANRETPETTVAYDEQYIRDQYLKNNLHIAEVSYGNWSGRRDVLNALQDAVIAVKA